MTFTWNTKNNFILLHSITVHQQESSRSDIDWSTIVEDICLEISSTPISLKNQYEHLLENFHLDSDDTKSLYATFTNKYLNSLCQTIEDNCELTLEVVYELIRHVRAQRININDIEQLIKESNFNNVSAEQKENKKRLFNILNRLRDYTRILSQKSSQLSECANTNVSSAIPKEMNDDNNQLISNTNEQEKNSLTRRRAQSLTIVPENNDNKINIGVEWFVPKFKHLQRSASLNARSQSPLPIDSSSTQNHNFVSNGIVVTTTGDNESSDSISNSKFRQTEAQPAIACLPVTNEQIVEKERRQVQLNSFNGQEFDPVSSSDSDSIEIQWSTSSNKKKSAGLLPHNLHEHDYDEHHSRKRQRLS